MTDTHSQYPVASFEGASNQAYNLKAQEALETEKQSAHAATEEGTFGWLWKIQDNTYFKIVIYALTLVTTSCLYFGWQPYSEMLWRGGAYSWLCPDGWNYDADGACDPQDAAVTYMYSFAQGTEFAGAFVAGLLLDHLGPRYTAFLGEAIFAIATLLIMCSNQSFQAYIPGLFLSGLAVNVVSFPSLTVMERLPARQALAVSIVIGAQSGASVIAPIMKWVWDQHPSATYTKMWGLYLLCIWLPVTLLYSFALPTQRAYKQLIHVVEQSKSVPEALENGTLKEDNSTDAGADNHADAAVLVGKAKWKAFLRDVLTWDYAAVAVFMFLLMLQFAYYPSVVRDATSDEVSNYIGWMTPLQAPFSIVIGFIMDYTGTCLVMYGMCCTLAFVSLGVALGASNTPLQKAVGFVFIFMQSATYNLKYTFVGETYDPFNFGKLVGALGIAGGIGVYCNAPITTIRNYKSIFLYFLIATGGMTLLATFLLIRQIQGIHHKTIEGIEQVHRVGFAKAKGSARVSATEAHELTPEKIV